MKLIHIYIYLVLIYLLENEIKNESKVTNKKSFHLSRLSRIEVKKI